MKTETLADEAKVDEMPELSDTDWARARPNRFAEAMTSGAILIVLDADVSAVFHSAEQVNAVLRALIQTMPGAQQPEGAGSGSD